MKVAVISGLALILAACASPGTPTGYADEATARAPRSCFWTRNVNNFAAAEDTVVNVRVGVRDVYQLELLGPCPDIDWTQRLAIESRGSSQICSGLDATIIAPTPIGPQRCAVRTVRKLSPAEIATLAPRARP